MRQRLISSKGKIIDEAAIEYKLDQLYDKSNIVERIERGLLKKMMCC
jgi:hypothetical protein